MPIKEDVYNEMQERLSAKGFSITREKMISYIDKFGEWIPTGTRDSIEFVNKIEPKLVEILSKAR